MRSEFEFIQNIKKKYSLNKVGDDCAVLPKDDKTDMVITADMLVEDIDFRLDWTTPEFLGHKALAVSLSDIAAMGAEPKWAMLSIGVPEKLWREDFIDKFYDGWHKLAGEFEVELIGGDVSRVPDKLVVDSIVVGEAAKGKAILRSGAQVSDLVYVSGFLGAAAYGLELHKPDYHEIKGFSKPMVDAKFRHAMPIPRVEIGQQLSALGILTSMIDISDGLSSDLLHICFASDVGARLEFSKIPVDPSLHDFNHDSWLADLVLHGGEDFELLFTVPKEKISALENISVTQIGEITSNGGIIELIRNGKTEILKPKGYRHF